MVVTISTVGYGDVLPSNEYSRMVVSMIIILAWILLPIQISKLYEVRGRRRRRRRRRRRSGNGLLTWGARA